MGAPLFEPWSKWPRHWYPCLQEISHASGVSAPARFACGEGPYGVWYGGPAHGTLDRGYDRVVEVIKGYQQSQSGQPRPYCSTCWELCEAVLALDWQAWLPELHRLMAVRETIAELARRKVAAEVAPAELFLTPTTMAVVMFQLGGSIHAIGVSPRMLRDGAVSVEWVVDGALEHIRNPRARGLRPNERPAELFNPSLGHDFARAIRAGAVQVLTRRQDVA